MLFFNISGKSRFWVCSDRYKSLNNNQKFKIPKNLENLNLDLSFGIGITKIHQIARFLWPIEVDKISDFSNIQPHFLKDSLRKWGKNPKNLKSDFTFKIVTFDVDH